LQPAPGASGAVQRIVGFVQASKAATKSNVSNGAHLTAHLLHEQGLGI
jgi:hypothetical protein